jgi:hypothetical protein
MTNLTRVLGFILVVGSITWGDGIANAVRFLEFERALPDKVLKAEKVLNPATGQIEVKLVLDGNESGLDLVALENQELRIRRDQNGALGPKLAAIAGQMGSQQTVKVAIHLKYPPISYPDKTRHSQEELQASSIAAAGVQPVTNLATLGLRHGLLGMENRGIGIAIAMVNKAQLSALKSDPDIASVEIVLEEALLSPELTTLAPSAYNPGSVPSGSGSGVKSATFELGLTSGFLSCIGVTPVSWDANTTGENWNIRHANATFRSMVTSAPSASFYHRRTDYYSGSGDISYLVDNGIQTVSMSVARGLTTPFRSTHAEFLVMDDFAYRYPYPVFVNPAANAGYQYEVNWQGYNGISVGNVRHTNNSTYEMADCTQAKNPPPVYGSCISGSGADCAGDREMPHLLVPGIPNTGSDFASSCLEGGGTVNCGTSWSAAVGNGMASNVIAANSRMAGWPEKVRAALILTAENVDGGDWYANTDGRDGAGVISGSEAVSFAQNHTSVSAGGAAAEKGMTAGSLYAADFTASNKRFNYVVPNPKPSGKHLRVVLTWDSNPVVGGSSNALSDLDLIVQTNSGTSGAYSWDNNVEVVDVAAASLTAGSSYYIDVDPAINRIPASGSRTNYTYYAIAWTWVKDEAP